MRIPDWALPQEAELPVQAAASTSQRDTQRRQRCFEARSVHMHQVLPSSSGGSVCRLESNRRRFSLTLYGVKQESPTVRDCKQT